MAFLWTNRCLCNAMASLVENLYAVSVASLWHSNSKRKTSGFPENLIRFERAEKSLLTVEHKAAGPACI